MLSEIERDHILRTLESCGGNKKQAAEVLGIDRSTLYAKLRAYGVLGS
jgi:two-component system response regulator HydG